MVYAFIKLQHFTHERFMFKKLAAISIALIGSSAFAATETEVIPAKCVAEYVLNGKVQARYEGACAYQHPMKGSPVGGVPKVSPPPFGVSFAKSSSVTNEPKPAPGLHVIVHIGYNQTAATINEPAWMGIEYNIVKDKGVQVIQVQTNDGKMIDFPLPRGEQTTGIAADIRKRGEMATVFKVTEGQNTDEIRIGFF